MADRASANTPVLGAIEAGGTKFVVAVGNGHDIIVDRVSIPTTTPAETLDTVVKWLRGHDPVDAVGISCFGPVDLDPGSPEWGHITATTKPHWSNTDIAGIIGAAMACPVGFDTDVNGAALGEYAYGAARGCNVAIYITVGTGIGGGAIVDGKVVYGSGHPEMGHIPIVRHPADGEYPGCCPFHGDCLEGLASGPAIEQRWGKTLSQMGRNSAAIEVIADYIAQLCITLVALYAPQRIVIGGGVLQAPGLLDHIRASTRRRSGAYWDLDETHLIVAPALADLSGIAGAFMLAQAQISSER